MTTMQVSPSNDPSYWQKDYNVQDPAGLSYR